MKYKTKEVLNVRYIKLRFTLSMLEECLLPVNKASAIRGGMGEMLLRANCIRNRECEICDFDEECIVQRTMYSKFNNKPEFITTGESVGYVIECENYQERFEAGDLLKFNLILFGKTIVYFSQYMQALFALGQSGLGSDFAKFMIVEVRNTRKQSILDGTNIYMKYYKVETLQDYVDYRKAQMEGRERKHSISFHTPLTQKYHGNFLQEFHMEAIVKSIQRRVYMLNCFEGYDVEEFYYEQFHVPEIVWQEARIIKVKRYSSRQDSAMYLRGIKGKIQLKELPEDILDILLVGELLHIGKNTSFGFGRYTIE